MKKIERKKVLFLNDNGEMDGHVAVLESDLDELEQRVERLEGVLSGDPNLTATKEQREMWRQSAVRYTDKCEIKIKELEQQRDEAVEALITVYYYTPSTWLCGNIDIKDIIERITGQAWEEIKVGKHE